MGLKKIYCIIVTYNGMQWIDKCLTSLQKSTYKPVILVIDNGSTDGTPAHINSYYKDVRLTVSDKNLGFGQGNNAALKVALLENADFFFLLNQDAWVTEDTIEKLVVAHTNNPAYGILSPVHLNGTGTGFDDHFEIFLTKSNIKKLLWNAIVNKTAADDIIDTPFVNAAAWLVSKQCLEKVGGFDPIFFHYGEDDNYGHRVLYHNLQIGILPTTVVYHDKERNPSLKKEEIKTAIKKDYIQFLVYACDINNNKFNTLILRRLFSCILKTGINILRFNRNEISYNFYITKRILFSYRAIQKSRLTNKKCNVRAYL